MIVALPTLAVIVAVLATRGFRALFDWMDRTEDEIRARIEGHR